MTYDWVPTLLAVAAVGLLVATVWLCAWGRAVTQLHGKAVSPSAQEVVIIATGAAELLGSIARVGDLWETRWAGQRVTCEVVEPLDFLTATGPDFGWVMRSIPHEGGEAFFLHMWGFEIQRGDWLLVMRDGQPVRVGRT